MFAISKSTRLSVCALLLFASAGLGLVESGDLVQDSPHAGRLDMAEGLAGHLMNDSMLLYRGELSFQGQVFDGAADIEFRLFANEASAAPISAPIIAADWPVRNGEFLVQLDFADPMLSQSGGWLEITVDGVILSPRQFIPPAGWSIIGGALSEDAVDAQRLESMFDEWLAARGLDARDSRPGIPNDGAGESDHGAAGGATGAGDGRSGNRLGGGAGGNNGASGPHRPALPGGDLGGGQDQGDDGEIFGASAGDDWVFRSPNILWTATKVGIGDRTPTQRLTVRGIIFSEEDATGSGGFMFPDATIQTTAWTGTSPPNGPAGGDLTGTYPDPEIDAGAVGTSEIADGSVGSLDLAADAVGATAIAAGAVGSAEIADGSVGAVDLSADAVGSAAIAAAAVNSSEIAAGAVGSAEIDTDAVGAAEIVASAVGADEIATDAVGALEIIADGVGADELATGAIGADEIATDAVGALEIIADGVGAAEIAAGAVGTSEILDASILGVDIDQQAATNGQVLTWTTASGWVPSNFIQSTLGVGRSVLTNALEVEGDASKTVAGDWLANSDRRIKTSVTTVTNALQTLDQVRLVSFRYTPEYLRNHPRIEDREYLNVIAQEFAQVFPDHVKQSGETLANGEPILQVDTYPLTIYSAAAIQELHDKVLRQDAEIASLNSRLAELEALLAELVAVQRE